MGFCLCDGYVMFSHGHGALAMEIWLCNGEERREVRAREVRDERELFTF